MNTQLTSMLPIKKIYGDMEIWLSELNIHQKEIQRFRQRLLMRGINELQVKKRLNQLELQFQLMEEISEDLIEKIKLHRFERSNFISETEVHEDEDYYGNHTDLHTDMEVFRKLFLETQKEVFAFSKENKKYITVFQ